MIDKDQNNNSSAVDRELEHFEAVNSNNFIINIDSTAIIFYEREEKCRSKKPRTTEGPRTTTTVTEARTREGIL